MEQRSGSGVNWFNYRDTAWKQAIISLAAAFVDFFFPETAKMMNRDLEISCTFEKTLHAQGAISSLGERRVDVLFDVPLLGEEPSSKIIFIEQQELKDLLMNLRCFEILILLLGMYFGSKIDGLVLCTGYENEGDYLTHELKAEHSRVKADIRTINLSSFKLKALENDDRVFALILYIALLEKLGGQEPARREESARKALKHLKGKNLSPKVMSACCLFAFILMRLDDAAINRELREDFKMFIIEHDKKMLEIGRLDGLKEGRREGRQEGRREGRQEERYEMVMKMLVKEMPLSTISELSGLSELEIIALRDGPRKNKAV